MKKILFMLTMLLALSSCSTVNRAQRLIYGDPAQKGNISARRILAGSDIISYRDRNTNAAIRASQSQDYTFEVVFGTIKLVNTDQDYIEVYEYDPNRSQDWLFLKRVYRNGPFADIVTQTNRQPQLISFAKGSNSRLFVTVHSAVFINGSLHKSALLRSYTF